MSIDLSRFKVVCREKVLHAPTLMGVEFKDGNFPADKSITNPNFLEVVAINEDGIPNTSTIRASKWKKHEHTLALFYEAKRRWEKK